MKKKDLMKKIVELEQRILILEMRPHSVPTIYPQPVYPWSPAWYITCTTNGSSSLTLPEGFTINQSLVNQ